MLFLCARHVSHSLLDKLKQRMDVNLQCGVTKKADQPTDWVHSLVIVEKENGILRLCLDPRDFNKVVKCEHYSSRNFKPPCWQDSLFHF